MKAWQRQVREQIAAKSDLLGQWWSKIDTDISRAEVREIDKRTAKEIILRYEWLGTMPARVFKCYGIFFSGVCGGTVVYAHEYTENLGVWDKYGFTGKIICLARGACTHWAHPHSASKLIRRSMDLLPAKYEVVTVLADARAGEIGTVYQACGFHYVGHMYGKSPRAEIMTADGRRIGSRQAFVMYGTRGVLKLQALGLTVNRAERKTRYFAFRGDRRIQRRHLAAIKHLIKPYPKRQSPEEGTEPNSEARFDPALPLQNTETCK